MVGGNMHFSSITKILAAAGILTIFCMILILSSPAVQAAEITLYPSGGDDGKLISEACKTYDSIILSAGTFWIYNSLYIPSGIKIKGQDYDETILQVKNPETFSYKTAGIICISGSDDIELSHFTFHGGETAQSNRQNSGHDWGNAIKITGDSSGCSFHDIYFTRLDGDAFRVSGSTHDNIVYNCRADTTGHDFVQLWGGKRWKIYNNLVNLNINTGVRFANSEDCELYRNTFYCNTGSGFVATEIEDHVSGINIHNNLYRDLNNAYHRGIGTVHASGHVDIHHNIFFNCDDISLTGVRYTFESNAYELGAIDDVGCSSKYVETPTVKAINPVNNALMNVYLSLPTTQKIQTKDNTTTEAGVKALETQDSGEITVEEQEQSKVENYTWITIIFQTFSGSGDFLVKLLPIMIVMIIIYFMVKVFWTAISKLL